MSDGTLALFDCAKAQKIRSSKLCNSQISALSFFNSSSNKLLIASADSGLQTAIVSPKIVLEEKAISPEKARRKKKNSI